MYFQKNHFNFYEFGIIGKLVNLLLDRANISIFSKVDKMYLLLLIVVFICKCLKMPNLYRAISVYMGIYGHISDCRLIALQRIHNSASIKFSWVAIFLCTRFTLHVVSFSSNLINIWRFHKVLLFYSTNCNGSIKSNSTCRVNYFNCTFV